MGDIVGLGIMQPEPIEAPFDDVWELMVDKVYNTSKYLPVSNVITREENGYVYREMTLQGSVKKEKIYLNKDAGLMFSYFIFFVSYQKLKFNYLIKK